MAPVVLPAAAGLELCLMKWGFLPFYAKDVKDAAKCFNAKSETAAEKPAFKQALAKRRCLVPVTGFYEWRQEEGKKRKTKYRFKLTGEDIFSLAGIWTPWTSPAGVTLLSFSILTTAPNDLMAQYHNRMPVILSREHESKWLSEDDTDRKSLFNPFPADLMNVEEATIAEVG